MICQEEIEAGLLLEPEAAAEWAGIAREQDQAVTVYVRSVGKRCLMAEVRRVFSRLVRSVARKWREPDA